MNAKLRKKEWNKKRWNSEERVITFSRVLLISIWTTRKFILLPEIMVAVKDFA